MQISTGLALHTSEAPKVATQGEYRLPRAWAIYQCSKPVADSQRAGK